jgi:hypothetical protein
MAVGQQLRAYLALPHAVHLLCVAKGVASLGNFVYPFLTLILVSTTIDYWAALRMESDPARRKVYLAFSLGSNLGLLGFF